jgi:hypothetical protein
MVRKKSYSHGDGTAYGDLSVVTPALRKIIQKRTSRKMPTLFWVDVRDYTLWKKAGVKSRGLDKMSGGGITINAVFESIVEYERR